MAEISESLRLPTEKQGLVTSSNHPLNDPSPTLSRPRSHDYYSRTTPEISYLLDTPNYNSHPIEMYPNFHPSLPPFLQFLSPLLTTHSSFSAGIDENDERMKRGE